MLTEKQLKACWMLANGRSKTQAYEAAGVGRRTFDRWLEKEDFQAALAVLSDQRRDAGPVVSADEQQADLNSSRADDLMAISHQREIVSELGALTLELVKHLREVGVEEISYRQLPSFTKSFIDSLASLQNANDRLIGLEALIADVQIIEETISLQTESEQSRGVDEGSGGGDA